MVVDRHRLLGLTLQDIVEGAFPGKLAAPYAAVRRHTRTDERPGMGGCYGDVQRGYQQSGVGEPCACGLLPGYRRQSSKGLAPGRPR